MKQTRNFSDCDWHIEVGCSVVTTYVISNILLFSICDKERVRCFYLEKMKFYSHLAVAGILSLLGYGHALVCTNGPGYVYLVWMSSTTNDESTYKIMGTSLAPLPMKINFKHPRQQLELKRYPVSDCYRAIFAVLTAVDQPSTSGDWVTGSLQNQEYFTVTVKNHPDKKVKFVRDIESAISEWVMFKVPPTLDRIHQGCGISRGYIHIFFLRFVLQDGSLLYCTRVFGSSRVVQLLSSTSDQLMSVPFMTQTPILQPAVYGVTDCLNAFSQIIHSIRLLNVIIPGYLSIHEQFGETYYKVARGDRYEDLALFQQYIVNAIRLYLDNPAVTVPTEEKHPIVAQKDHSN